MMNRPTPSQQHRGEDISQVSACGTVASDQPLKPMTIVRRNLLDHDVMVEILYCGICHSDIHTARNEWSGTTFPCVPGHEITGIVTEKGPKVSKFKVGDKCGVGVFVDTCQACKNCKSELEQYCSNEIVLTYNSNDNKYDGGRNTLGGYSKSIVVNEDVVLHWPEGLSMESGAPLLCAGITVYSPLRHCKAGPGKKIGVVGLGGLGHVAVQMAHHMGAWVAVFSRGVSESKQKLAKDLGADEFIATGDGQTPLTKWHNHFDILIDTVSNIHSVNQLLPTLGFEGKLVIVGLPPESLSIHAAPLIMQRRKILGSMVGSLREMQEMLRFCDEKKITCMIESIKMDQVNEAFDRVVDGKVHFRFVIDVKNSEFE